METYRDTSTLGTNTFVFDILWFTYNQSQKGVPLRVYVDSKTIPSSLGVSCPVVSVTQSVISHPYPLFDLKEILHFLDVWVPVNWLRGAVLNALIFSPIPLTLEVILLSLKDSKPLQITLSK